MNTPSESPVPCHLGGTQFIMRWAGPPLAERVTINTDADVRAIWKEHVASLAHFDGSKEHMIMIGLNTRRHFLGWHLVAIGSADDVSVNFRDIFRAVFAIDALSVILVHNHPSGDVRPSRTDERFTRNVMDRFRVVGVEFRDHVIVDSEGSTSYSMQAGYSDIWPGAAERPTAPEIVPLVPVGGQSTTLPKAVADAFLSVSPCMPARSFEMRSDGLFELHFRIPQSVWNDFQTYGRRSCGSGSPLDRSWQYAPILFSLGVGIPDEGKYGWDTPINKRPMSGLSLSGRVKQLRRLAKREPMVDVTEKVALVFWEKIQARAAFYGITPGELCVSCLAYHAGLEQKSREREEKRSDFSMFHSVRGTNQGRKIAALELNED